jgi:hypothetical protein
MMLQNVGTLHVLVLGMHFETPKEFWPSETILPYLIVRYNPLLN